MDLFFFFRSLQVIDDPGLLLRISLTFFKEMRFPTETNAPFPRTQLVASQCLQLPVTAFLNHLWRPTEQKNESEFSKGAQATDKYTFIS